MVGETIRAGPGELGGSGGWEVGPGLRRLSSRVLSHCYVVKPR